MNCSSCGFRNPAGMQFCGSCGSALEPGCSRCGFKNPEGFAFCGQCGARLGAPAGSGGHRPTTSPRQAYTPKHLAEKILTARSAIEGERKQVTVLFADIKGSMALAEQIDPEEWHRILDHFFTILSGGVHRFEGTINQFTGDGIMALFGAPIAHEDHAQRACYAALHLDTGLRRYADELRIQRGIDFSVRMGINSGDVIVGTVGDDLRMDYTAQGHTVGLASRMEQLAAAGRTYLTEHTAKLVTGYFRLRDLGRSRVKGISEPLRVFELEGVGDVRTRFDASRARGLSRFVGRDADMQALEAVLDRVVEGEGQVVGVVAEPGMGKTRLCYEFAERCRAKGIPVREGHGVAHGKMVPFLPVLEFLRNYFEITERESARTARNKIAGALLLLDRAFESALPLMFEFLGVSDSDKAAPSGPPEARQQQLFKVVRGLIRAGSEQSPGVILIEDLHWIDQGTEAFIESVVEAVAATRTLLLVNFRPEYHAAWMQKPHYRQIPLLPLGSDAIRELLIDLLGEHSSLAGLGERIQDHTRGNPFFLEEVVQSLAETGSLVGTRGNYRLVAPVPRLGIPPTVQAVLAARIDRLAERDKYLLQIASVIGREFSESILRQVAGHTDVRFPQDELADALGTLAAAGFLYERAIYPEAEYTFKHPLTREIAYASQLSRVRGRVHGAVAGAVAAERPDKLDERAGLLAHHWEGAGEPLEAARWHRRAARWAGLSHPTEGFAHWHKVLDLVAPLPTSQETDELGAFARAQIIFFGARIGAAAGEMDALYREGSELARRSGNDVALARISSSYGDFLYFATGILDDALEHVSRGLDLADRTDDLGLRIATRYTVANCCNYAGRLERVLVSTAEGLDLCGEDPDIGADLIGISPRAGLRLLRSLALGTAGRASDARDLKDPISEFVGERADVLVEALAHYVVGEQFRLLGDAPRAIDACQRSVDRVERLGGQPFRINSYCSLGAAFVLGGQWNDALQALEHATALMIELGSYRYIEGRCLATLALALLGFGKPERAREAVQAAVPIADRNGWLPACDAQLALAHVLAAAEGRGAATMIEGALDRADELVVLSGARSRQPMIHEQRAELATLQGDERKRDSELREASRQFAEMGATGHTRRLERTFGLLLL